MKFREWEDFADQINEYGRYGYIKKQSTYNPFTKVNVMIMIHHTRGDEEIFVLYPDDDSYDLDWENEPYVRPPLKAETNFDDTTKRRFEQVVDRRTREHRSNKYSDKPGTRKEESPHPKPGPPKPRPFPKKEDPK